MIGTMCRIGIGIMLKKRVIRFVVAWLFDQMSDETIEMFNEEIDKELEERNG